MFRLKSLVLTTILSDSYYPHDESDWRVSPLLAEKHAGLPPTYIQVAGSDILRDEGIAYAKVLQQAGYVKRQVHERILTLPQCANRI